MKLAHAVLGAAVGFSVSVLGASPELAGTAETNYYPSVASGLAPEGEEYFSVCTVYDDIGCPATNINEYVTKGGPKPDVEDGLSDYLRHLDDDGGSCSCSCSEATTIDDLCVYFAQWFGRSALNPEMPVGRLLIREDSPGPKLLSPKCLQYDSPFERKFYGAVIGPALVRRPGRRAAVYYDGLPVLGSSLARSSVEFLLDEDLHRETFADRSSVLYSGSEAVFYVTPQGRRIHRSESGTTVVRGSDGAIRQIYSEADGLIDVATRSDGFTVAWYPPSGVSSVAGLPPRVETTAYDAEGRVVSRTDPAGRTTAFAYSADGRTVVETLANGAAKTTVRDAYGRVASVTGSAVTPEWHFRGVDASGEWERTVLGDPDSARATTVWRDGLGRAWREERPGANGSTLETYRLYGWTGQLYDEFESGRPTRSYEYDGLGNLVATTLAADGVSRTQETGSAFAEIGGEVWSVASNIVYTSDASIAPVATSTRRRLSGLSPACESHVVSVDAWGGEGEEWTSFDAGSREETTHRRVPGVANTAISVALDGRTVREVSFAAVTNTAAYDAYGRVVRRTDGAGASTAYAYDARGFLASVTDPLGATTSYGYDLMGDRVSETDALDNRTLRAYDLRGRLVREEGASYPVDHAYDVFGDRVATTTWRDASGPAGDTTRWLRDEATGAVTNKVYADGSRVAYAYTDDGKLAERVWARGVRTWYAYDGWGNLLSTVYSDATPSVECDYDALGRMVVCADAAGVAWTAYGDHGEKVSEFTASADATHMTDFHHDAFGRDAGYSFDDERRTTLAYDPDTGRLCAMQSLGSAAPFAWSYDGATGRKSSLAYPNGISAQWTYDARGDLVRVRNGTADSAISQYDYTCDAAGRRTRIAKGGGAFAAARSDDYGYNARGELVSAVEPDLGEEYAYAYDDIGNRLASEEPESAKTYVANELNQYTAIADGAGVVENPVFDLDGNQTRITTKTGTWNVAYNGENRPVLWSNGITNIVMSYDRMGRRVACDSSLAGVISIESKRFSYNGYLLVHEERLATDLQPDAVACDYVWDPTEPVATRPLVFRTQSQSQLSPTVLYYTHDGNKNVSELVGQNATVAAHYEYAPFGAVTTATGSSAIANPFRFSSEYADDDTATVYYNYRHYEPIAGRWLSRDSIEEIGGIGLYSFCKNEFFAYDILGLWLSRRHRKLTERSFDAIKDQVFSSEENYDLDKIRKIIVDANVSTDKGALGDDQGYHYCRRVGENVDYKERYKTYLKSKYKEFQDAITPNTLDCQKALEVLGILCHMFQDYYGHGVKNNSGWNWYGYGVEAIDGDPYRPRTEPTSYRGLGFLGSHGGIFRILNPLSRVEPGDRAGDSRKRRHLAKMFTKARLRAFLMQWKEACKCDEAWRKPSK